MKKFKALLISTALVASLSACTPDAYIKTADKDTNNSVANIVQKIETDTNNDVNSQNVTEDDKKSPYADMKYTSYPAWSVYDSIVENDYFTNSEGQYFEKARTEYSDIHVSSYEGNGYEYKELSERLQKINEDNRTNLEKTFEGFINDWEETFKDSDINWGPVFYETDHKGVIRADQKVFSVMCNAETYYGGAHGGNYLGGYNINSQTGEDIAFEDVFLKTEGLSEILADELYENYDQDIFFAETKEALKDTIDDLFDTNSIGWTINYQGVAFYFGDYFVAPYACGHQVVYVNYDEYPEYLNPEYFTDADTEYVLRANANAYYPILIDGEEKNICFSWDKSYNEESGYYSETYEILHIWGDDFYQEERLAGSMMDPVVYIIRRNGKDYIYVQNYYFDGVEMLQFFEYEDGEFVEKEKFSGGISFNTNELTGVDYESNGSFCFNFAFSKADSVIGEDGQLEISDVYFYYIYNNWEDDDYYTASEDLKCKTSDKDGKPLEGETTLKKGTVVTPYSTDHESFIVLIDENGNYYSFDITIRDDHEIIINGKTTFDLFEHYSNW